MGREHAKAVQRLPELATVVAVVDPHEEARSSFQSLVPEARTYATLDELLLEGAVRPDVVHVCTAPAQTHAAIAERALEAGAHIYVEKPFVDNTAAAAELLALADANKLKVCCGYQLLFQSVAEEAVQFLESPGSTVHVESYFSFKPSRTGPNVRLRISEEEQLLDILPHPTYLLLAFLTKASPDFRMELEALDIGGSGSVHALIRRGAARGVLCVSLEARPVESMVQIMRSNGRMQVDFMRGTVQRLQGAGTSVLQKILDPFRWAWQLGIGTTAALAARVLGRQGGYLGLDRLLEGFYRSIVEGTPSPISPELIADTVKVCDAVRCAAKRLSVSATGQQARSGGNYGIVCVTGGTGFLGRRLATELVRADRAVRVVSRRMPPPWAEVPGIDYVVCDLGEAVPSSVFDGCECVIHLAAATAGGYEAHQRDSVDATRHVIEAAAHAGVEKVVYVSSLAVVDPKGGQHPLDESSALLTGRDAGPYAWGKAMAEKESAQVGRERGVPLRIVRPGPIVDFERFDPPGRLGRWIGSWFVAVGPANERLYIVDVQFMARTLSWVANHFDEAPELLHALSPRPPTRRELVTRLRAANPKARVVWIPRPGLATLSALATTVQKVLRPGQAAISLSKAFASTRYDLTLIESLENDIQEGRAPALPPGLRDR